MAGDGSHGGPRSLSETYPIDLTSKTIYDNMEINHSDLSHYDEKCNITFSSKDNDKVKEICKKTLRYLEKSNVWNIQNSRYDSCMLLNYWIYDKLNNILGDKGTADVAFGSLQFPWNYTMNNRSNITYSNKCKDNFEILNHVDWKKRKELYDYYVDIETLVSTANNFVDQCKYYYEYIDKKTELYKHFEGLCSTEQNKCPISLEDYKRYNPNMVLSKLPCHDEMVRKKATAQPQALQQEAEPGPRSLGSDMPRLADGSDTARTQENSDIGTKVGHSVLGVAPVLLTATALYRYTPLGPWFLKLSGGSPNSISDMEGFSSYTQESGDIFSHNAENYISYQPI